MPTKNHPASVAEIDDALGTPGSFNASRKIGLVEERIFEPLLQVVKTAAKSGREDRERTAFETPLKTLFAVCRNRPVSEFEEWIDQYWREYQTRKRLAERERRHGQG